MQMKKKKRVPWNKGKIKFYCDMCDGCGWYEGGGTLKTFCSTCKGKGFVWILRG
jgi:DnaJ-class molecular chaperone